MPLLFLVLYLGFAELSRLFVADPGAFFGHRQPLPPMIPHRIFIRPSRFLHSLRIAFARRVVRWRAKLKQRRERAMKTRLRGLASGWRARAGTTHEGPPGVPPVRGVKIESRTVRRARLAMVLAAGAMLGLAYLLSEQFRAEANRAAGILWRGDVAALRDYILSFGAWAPVVSALLMVLQALVAPLPAFLITFANGLAFGAFWGGVLSLTSASLAAAISFWLARALGRAPVEALVGKTGLESADRWFARWGTYAVLVARLVPILSFDVISFAAGLTRMRFWGFLAVTVVGAAPATFAYAYLGERAPQYVQVLLIAFGIVIAGAVVAAVVRRRRSGKPVP